MIKANWNGTVSININIPESDVVPGATEELKRKINEYMDEFDKMLKAVILENIMDNMQEYVKVNIKKEKDSMKGDSEE